jgi:hypothetical protein
VSRLSLNITPTGLSTYTTFFVFCESYSSCPRSRVSAEKIVNTSAALCS